MRQWDQRSLIQPALWSGVCRWHQLDVLGAQQARLSELGDGVGRQIDAAVQTHRDQGMPALPLDAGDVADRDVTDAHP